MSAEITAQIQRDLDARITAPTAAVLGLDLGDLLRHRICDRARTIAATIIGRGDEAEGAASDLMYLLWGESDPPADWWRTPLGRAVAGATTDTGESVTWSTAAAMLGITKGSINQMMSRGTLDRHPDGGVLRGSVMQRLARTNDEMGPTHP